MGLTLYVGCDDSNHGNKKKKGEIIVATFSILYGDEKVINLGNKRDSVKALRYASVPGRGYNLTIRAGDQYFGSQNLPKVLPTLIHYYLLENPSLEISELCAFFDGEIRKESKKFFLEDVRNIDSLSGLESVSAEGFVKKKTKIVGGFQKSYECPRLVWCADSIASSLGGLGVRELFEHPKMVVPLVDF